MGFQVSPGVNVSEIDLTTVVPAVSTTTGAIAGTFAWGPVDERILVSSEVDLVRRFGEPTTGYNVETFFTAADFLAYGNALYVVRVSDGNTAVSDANTSISANLDDLTAAYPGAHGNALRVYIVNSDTWANSTYEATFDSAPESNTHVHVAVVDTDGTFTGTANTIVELYDNVSLTAGAKTVDGTNNYLPDVIEQSSRYIAVTEAFATAISEYFTSQGAEFLSALTGGTNGSDEATIAQSELRAGYDLYKNAEEVDISLVLMGKAIGTSHKGELANYVIQNICEFRKDCIAFVSPDRADVVANSGSETTAIIDFRDNMTSSSYGVLDSGYKYRYDKYNDRYIYTPLNGDIAGLCVRTDDQRDPWFSPAGYNRGIIKNIVKLAFNPNKTHRDALYKKGVNPVITQPGQGTLLFGDKTLLARPSAFDRINVRRLFIVLEKAIALAAKSTLFEFNDEFTRAQFVNLVEPFLRDVEGRRGIYDFRVVCNETNNTPEIIDRNEFVGDIYIKPAKSINFIQLNFVAVRTGVEFEEIVGRF